MLTEQQAIALHQGKAVEMENGDGKSLGGIFTIYLNALTEKGVHVYTLNDFLARQYVQKYGHMSRYLSRP